MTRFSSAQRRRHKMQATEPRTMRPWKAFRIAIRVIIFSFLAWLLLALLWAFLPSPVDIADDEHVKTRLLSGEIITRAFLATKWHDGPYQREGFAIEFSIENPDSQHLELSVAGIFPQGLPLYNHGLIMNASNPEPEIIKPVPILARIGDTDGANLPIFSFADSVLLFWWIHRETIEMELVARWTFVPGFVEDPVPRQTLDIHFLRRYGSPAGEPLLSIDTHKPIGKKGGDVTSVSFGEGSESPTKTYPLRVAIIYILAPATVFVNDWLGSIFATGFNFIGIAFIVILYTFMLSFIFLAVFVSCWRCLGGPGLESMVGRVQGRLDRWQENETLSWARIDLIQDGLDKIQRNRLVKSALRVCSEGWHPERDREWLLRQQEEAQVDMEKGNGVRIRIRK